MEKLDKAKILSSLIYKCQEGALSREEEIELDAWLAESEENRSLFTELTDKSKLPEKLKIYSQINSEAIWEKTLQQIEPDAKVIPLYPVQRAWWKYATAAAVILTLSAGAWFYFKPVPTQPVADKQVPKETTDEIVPGSSKAVLTLSDGKKIVLDEAGEQKPIQESNYTISRTSGRLIYNGENEANGRDPIAVGSKALYNTVTTPRGGQYQITLPDGSVVWLNAASSLRFPIAFAGSERNVLLTGEAFFEVAPMADKPFRVAVQTPSGDDGGRIEVLGTHFNINAYTDDAVVRTTLLEGSVKVSTRDVHKLLKPGQAADVAMSGTINVKKVDTVDVAAYRNGYFSFKEASVHTVMQQIARWYDLTIEYSGKMPVKSLNGKISRGYTIEEVLQVLKVNGIQTDLRKKDRRLVVMS